MIIQCSERFSKLSCVTVVAVILSYYPVAGEPAHATTKLCISITNTIRARHKSCFLRPDTGPCRADIIQWYFDAKAAKCYRFFWGGCQGNGNRFQAKEKCLEHCWLNRTSAPKQRPNFCDLRFAYGSCFGHYYRWYFDRTYKDCKRRIYSGCGGNQNNFETMEECRSNCISYPNNTYGLYPQFTTCIPLDLPDMKRKRKKRDLGITLPYKKRQLLKQMLHNMKRTRQ